MSEDVKCEKVSLITIGDCGAGKTALIRRFMFNKFELNYKSTIGIDCVVKMANISDKMKIKINIWDTAGQEMFSILPKNYLKKADGILFVYDITSTKSFDKMVELLSNTINLDQINIPFVVIGNKKDLEETREVSFYSSQKSIREYTSDIFETSALSGENVGVTFSKLIVKVLYHKNKKEFAEALEQLEIEKNLTDVSISSTSSDTTTSKNENNNNIILDKEKTNSKAKCCK